MKPDFFGNIVPLSGTFCTKQPMSFVIHSILGAALSCLIASGGNLNQGIAGKYPKDAGIEKDERVVFFRKL